MSRPLPSQAAKDYVNDQQLEVAWAIKAYHHAETYFNLISSVDSRQLKLTKHDDELYQHFRQDFPDMNIAELDEAELKSDAAKKRWRPFCNHFDGTITDFNFGTLLRLNSSEDYSEKNSVFVPRVQFCAIEVARNREGCNQAVWKMRKHKEDESFSKAGDTKQSENATESGDANSNEMTATS